MRGRSLLPISLACLFDSGQQPDARPRFLPKRDTVSESSTQEGVRLSRNAACSAWANQFARNAAYKTLTEHRGARFGALTRGGTAERESCANSGRVVQSFEARGGSGCGGAMLKEAGVAARTES